MNKFLVRFFYTVFFFCTWINITIGQQYQWGNVKIGGGGFVSGLVFNPVEKDLLYARTDVGGAYRWDAATKTWIPLTDFLGQDDENFSGVLSMAADPSDANRVYMATGLYTQSWAGTGAIFSSANKGASWTKTNLSIKLGGNEDGRNTGERLAVDPNKGSILYLGSSKDGLWKSTDYGATWNKINTFPLTTFSGAGASFVLFDKTTGSAGNATQTIYVGVLQTGTNLYKSSDGGNTWNAVPNQPTGLMPHQAALASNGTMYITYSDGPGPNNISSGAVYKLNTATNVFTAINPPAGQGGYAGVSVSATDPNTVVVSTIDRWWPRDEVYRSTDAGGSWKPLLASATWDHSSAPYTGGYTPHWLGDVELDPYDAGKAWFVTGYGVYQSENVTNANSNTPVAFTFQNNGLEEIVAVTLVAPPTGAPLLSSVGDQDGFRHIDLNVSPAGGRFSPGYGSGAGIDFAQSNPNYVARTYPNANGNYGSYSNDQGITWTKFASYPSGTNSGGNIAVSANAATLVWSGQGASAVYYSTNNGGSWQASAGTAGGLSIVSDRVNANKFYGYNASTGICLASADGGLSFSNAAIGLPTLQSWELWMSSTVSVPGSEGDVWITSGYNGLYRSTNSGTNFTKIATVGAAYKVAFGKSAEGSSYPTVYIVGRVNNVYGIYRSVDAGANWVRINDDQHQFITMRAFAADANVFGRVYLGTSGRGLIYGTDETALPIKLASFSGQLIKTNNNSLVAKLSWTITSEVSQSYFEIEKSVDGNNWQKVGSLPAERGATGVLQEYTYNDAVTNTTAKCYYRLKIVNIDGASYYSGVVPFSFANLQRFNATISPNPVVGNALLVNLSSESKIKVAMTICDVKGAVLYNGQVQVNAGTTALQLANVPVLAKGLYMLRMYSSDNKQQIAAIKFVQQ